MVTPLHIELERHAAALRALARQLVGDQRADDLVQDVSLQALEATQPPAGWRGWLQVVLRRRASNLCRGEQRRQRREAAVAVAQSSEAAPTVAVAAQQEMVRKVTEELLALPEPYRDTLFRRFFGDDVPAAIAAATGVPLATVKSRLQRGLSMLRSRLDDDERCDWRPALAAAFGLRPGAMGTAALAGGVIMTLGAKVLLGGVLAVASWVLYVAVAGGEPEPAVAVAAHDLAPAPEAVVADAPVQERVEVEPKVAVAQRDARPRVRIVDQTTLRGVAGATLRLSATMPMPEEKVLASSPVADGGAFGPSDAEGLVAVEAAMIGRSYYHDVTHAAYIESATVDEPLRITAAVPSIQVLSPLVVVVHFEGDRVITSSAPAVGVGDLPGPLMPRMVGMYKSVCDRFPNSVHTYCMPGGRFVPGSQTAFRVLFEKSGWCDGAGTFVRLVDLGSPETITITPPATPAPALARVKILAPPPILTGNKVVPRIAADFEVELLNTDAKTEHFTRYIPFGKEVELVAGDYRGSAKGLHVAAALTPIRFTVQPGEVTEIQTAWASDAWCYLVFATTDDDGVVPNALLSTTAVDSKGVAVEASFVPDGRFVFWSRRLWTHSQLRTHLYATSTVPVDPQLGTRLCIVRFALTRKR